MSVAILPTIPPVVSDHPLRATFHDIYTLVLETMDVSGGVGRQLAALASQGMRQCEHAINAGHRDGGCGRDPILMALDEFERFAAASLLPMAEVRRAVSASGVARLTRLRELAESDAMATPEPRESLAISARRRPLPLRAVVEDGGVGGCCNGIDAECNGCVHGPGEC